MRSALATMACISTLALLAGCLNGLEKIQNDTDQFAYGGSFSNQNGAKTFTWQTTGTVAAVNWGTANAEKGSVRVTVKDATGATVYDGTLAAGSKTATVAEGVSGSGTSQFSKTGTAGAWTIRITFTDYAGAMGLSVQKKGKAFETSDQQP